ncbi:hypothetical protein SCUCBS95973_009383 [Sporothrix curviconia]|uniref:Cation-transporting P-type ATPase N-terminal domain-containing protein n=1 Tax=Sporothrix curviconia TaxID=1260050 RepID=A0ABP0CUR5_9PEZI
MAVENTLVWQDADDGEKGRGRIVHRDFGDEGAPSSSSRPVQRTMRSRQRSRSSRRSIDPSTAFPIQYRTLSQDIDDTERQRKGEQAKAKDAMVSKFETIDWHKITPAELERRLDTSIVAGLPGDSARERLRKHGANAISPLPNPWVGKVLGYFFKGFGSILAVGGILVFLSWKPLGEPNPAVANLALGIVLIAVFLIQAAFNGWQDWSSSRVMQSITAMLPASCHVLRENGTQMEISASELVPGDVLLLTAGDRIPADVRYVRVSHDMTVDRAVLTGESKPIKASASEAAGDGTSNSNNYLETSCIGLQGTHCVTGTARAVVVATGDATVFGQIAKLTGTPKTGLTTMEREILRFLLLIFAIMVTWIVVLAAVWGGWLRKAHPDWISVPMLIVSRVSVAIAYIPEGLPIATTASLTITANLMKKHRILCKSLKTVETLRAVSVICSDKTGTLTKNKMFVTDCSLGVTTYSTDEAVLLAESVASTSLPSPLTQLGAGTGLCNAATFDASGADGKGERRIFGNATDQAALRLADSLSPLPMLRSAWTAVAELAFDSKTMYTATALALNDRTGSKATAHLCLTASEVAASTFGRTHPSEPPLPLHASQQSTLLFLKGAPDLLLDKCTRIVQAGVGEGGSSVVELTPSTREAVRLTKDEFVFVHSDLDRQNILVDPDTFQIVCILDWETAGFFPQEWELPKWKMEQRSREKSIMTKEAKKRQLAFFGAGFAGEDAE